MGLFGFGTSENTTKTDVTNQQVATESGIATGGSGNNTKISIQTADPEVAKSAIIGQTLTTDRALTFGENVVGANTALNASAINAIASNANLAILGSNDLATKFAKSTSDQQAKNIDLLQSLSDQSAQAELRSQNLAAGALDASFAISKSVAPQSSAFQTESVVGSFSKITYVVIAVAGLIFALYAFRRK